jgi:hypothetical protein
MKCEAVLIRYEPLTERMNTTQASPAGMTIHAAMA